MKLSHLRTLRAASLLFAGAILIVISVGPSATARPAAQNAWDVVYPNSDSDVVAQCQLCHAAEPAGASWNQYGWDIRESRQSAPGCETWVDAIQCVESDLSVSETGGYTYLDEIQANTQPGWTEANANAIYTSVGETFNEPPFPGLAPYDPAGMGGMGGIGGMGGDGGMGGAGGTGGAGGDCPTTGTIPPDQIEAGMITVKPGQSIQEAIDLADEGTEIRIEPGIYEEPCNSTNGLNVTKNGIRLIGLSTSAAGPDAVQSERVVVRSTGTQRNGIVIVPPEVPADAQPLFSTKVERTECMSCHVDMAPPFPLHAGVPDVIPKQNDPWLTDIVVQGITIQGFENNGLFTEHVDGFVFDDVESRENRNYGIFPVLSANGVIRNSYSTGSDLDSALWVETSVNVDVTNNLVENSVNGIEVSNSDDVLLADNEMRNNTVGAAILLLPDIYENRSSAKRIDMENNWLHDNNRPNTARPGAILAEIPSGIGIIYLGVDDSTVTGNLVENNDFAGIAIVDYCLPLLGTDFACTVDPTVTEEFLADEAAENNRVVCNTLVGNATNLDPDNPFVQYAGDLVLLTVEDHGNCFSANEYETEFSFIGELPACPDAPETCGAGGMGGAGGMEGDSSGCSCTVGGPSPFRFSTTWLILVGALALLLRRRLRKR